MSRMQAKFRVTRVVAETEGVTPPVAWKVVLRRIPMSKVETVDIGHVEMWLSNPEAADIFQPGREVFVDFTYQDEHNRTVR